MEELKSPWDQVPYGHIQRFLIEGKGVLTYQVRRATEAIPYDHLHAEFRRNGHFRPSKAYVRAYSPFEYRSFTRYAIDFINLFHELSRKEGHYLVTTPAKDVTAARPLSLVVSDTAHFVIDKTAELFTDLRRAWKGQNFLGVKA